jgi:hypothetical protein
MSATGDSEAMFRGRMTHARKQRRSTNPQCAKDILAGLSAGSPHRKPMFLGCDGGWRYRCWSGRGGSRKRYRNSDDCCRELSELGSLGRSTGCSEKPPIQARSGQWARELERRGRRSIRRVPNCNEHAARLFPGKGRWPQCSALSATLRFASHR